TRLAAARSRNCAPLTYPRRLRHACGMSGRRSQRSGGAVHHGRVPAGPDPPHALRAPPPPPGAGGPRPPGSGWWPLPPTWPGAPVALPIAERKLRSTGWDSSVYPVWSLTSGHGLQLVVRTAGLLAVAAIIALSAGAMLRRTAGAIAAVVVLLI